ncbi:MAG: hydrogenase maturation nickel metallochaperone HypA [Ktedonobacteraceae bacterium]
MHELAIAEQIVDVVMTQVEVHHIEHVTGVRIQVGEAIGVVADSLTFSFEMIASFTPELVGAHLVIDSVPYRAKCRHCHQEFTVKHFVVQCPTCETWEADVISGTEFKVLDMDTA